MYCNYRLIPQKTCFKNFNTVVGVLENGLSRPLDQIEVDERPKKA